MNLQYEVRYRGDDIRTYLQKYQGSNKGKKFSQEWKDKISASNKGNTSWKNEETGKHYNDQRVEVECAFCKKEIFRKRPQLKYKRNFCSTECHGKWNSENLKGETHPMYLKKIIPCGYCGKEILCTPNRIKRVKRGKIFCCKEHNDLWRKENVRGEMLYNWKGGYDPNYGVSWLTAKRTARKRDNDTCQRCGITKEELGKNMDVHHIKPFRDFGVENHIEANSLNNLISYCNKCHKIVEEELNKKLKTQSNA